MDDAVCQQLLQPGIVSCQSAPSRQHLQAGVVLAAASHGTPDHFDCLCQPSPDGLGIWPRGHHFHNCEHTALDTALIWSCLHSDGQNHGQATMRQSGTGAHRARPGLHVPHQRRGPVALTAAVRAVDCRCRYRRGSVSSVSSGCTRWHGAAAAQTRPSLMPASQRHNCWLSPPVTESCFASAPALRNL